MHVFWLQAIVHELQKANDFTDATRPLLGKDDPWMNFAGVVDSEKIFIVREDYPSREQHVPQLLLV